VRATIRGFERARLSVDEAGDALAATAARLTIPLADGPSQDLDILGISGGAAGGAFGAGVLVGLSRAAARPRFQIVTGARTAAPMAPFAFLGSDWGARLTDASTSVWERSKKYGVGIPILTPLSGTSSSAI